MTLTTQRRINGKKDNCPVTRNEDGTIYVGSITLAADETDEFLKLLAQAIREVMVRDE